MTPSMKDFLVTLKLVQFLQIELEVDKADFVKILKSNVDLGSTSRMFSGFEAFSSSKNEFKGNVSAIGFELRKRRRFFDMNGAAMAVAKGKFTQRGEKLIIDCEVNGYHWFMGVILGVLILFYVFMGIGIMAAGDGLDTFFAVPFIIVHGLFMMGIPYFIMRMGVRKTHRELERELYFMLKDYRPKARL